ncbi:hypothetical protein [Arthrobacter sp. H14-L1]|uniref:hypothetical protein n=1 Tax=Arthrobacter sp. H14-L1 TaxID=2996697 RepID=UPI002271EBE3|nr:hypothetical protein [Arthrobacter sp. H14-L1]MCY0906426.1 hypothetical protein [Arthrobacter sp. H14-L1]
MQHLDSLAAAVSEADELTRTRLRALVDAVCLFALILPVAAGVGAFVNVVGAMKDAPSVDSGLTQATRTRRGLIDQALRAGAGRQLEVGTRAVATEAAENSARELALVAGIVPFSIVVDDAEMLDEITVAMLKVVLRHSTARGLIVLAVNTDIPMSEDLSGRLPQSVAG